MMTYQQITKDLNQKIKELDEAIEMTELYDLGYTDHYVFLKKAKRAIQKALKKIERDGLSYARKTTGRN